jgi:hypothetical protein
LGRIEHLIQNNWLVELNEKEKEILLKNDSDGRAKKKICFSTPELLYGTNDPATTRQYAGPSFASLVSRFFGNQDDDHSY